ncbi:MAG TPA: hypothetical protein VKT28_08435, partial [Puia sp.]|nr:hypothetical protein [Puia sp.]
MKFAIYILAFFLLSGLVSIAQIHKKPTVSSVVSKDPLDYYLKALKLKDDSLPAKKIKLIPDSSKYKPEKFFIAQVEDSTKGNDSIG